MIRPVPIVLFAYARPYHLSRVLEGLESNSIPLLYAFSDGPKEASKSPLVSQVRQILREIDWCEMQLFERDTNLGLGTSIRNGVSQVLEEHDRLIVVEDDVVLRPGAYEYVVAALERYAEEPKVMTVSMWSDSTLVPPDAEGGFFSKRFVCWGWATYRSAWQEYVGTPLEVYQRCTRNGVKVLNWGADLKWQAEHAAERNLWYVGYALTHFLYHGVSYFPGESLTVNIGRDGSGENVGGIGQDANMPLIDEPVWLPKTWPDVRVSRGLDEQFTAYFAPRQRTLWDKVRTRLGRIKKLLLSATS